MACTWKIRQNPSPLVALVVFVATLDVGTSQFPPEIHQISNNPDQEVNDKILYCEVRTGTNSIHSVVNAQYYLNDTTNILDELTGGEVSFPTIGGRNTISFQLTQELEGLYTCGNGTDFRSRNDLALALVSLPTADQTIDQYYAVPVGGAVIMECGILQGALGGSYTPRWVRDGFKTLNTDTGSTFQINRLDKLQDFSLTILPVALGDNGTYVCSVDIKLDSQNEPFVESPKIILIVYEAPSITFLTGDQILVVPSNASQTLNQQFICNATGGPDLKIQWKHNDELIAKDKYSVNSVKVSADGHLMALHSVLTITIPGLDDSGRIVCQATIEYGQDGSRNVNNLMIETRSIERGVNLIVLDSSLEPRPIPTQDEDLLVRIDLPDGAVISEEIRVRLRMTPDGDGEPVEISVDGEFFDVTTFYPFIPASQLPFRQFWIQVSMIVDNKMGPFNPPEVNELQFIDYDESDGCTCDNQFTIIVCVGAGVIAIIIITIIIAFVVGYVVKKKVKEEIDLHKLPSGDATRDGLLKHLESLNKQLETASERNNVDHVNYLKKRIEHFESVFENIVQVCTGAVTADGFEHTNITADAAGDSATPVAGGIRADGDGGEGEDEDFMAKSSAVMVVDVDAVKARLDRLIQRVKDFNPPTLCVPPLHGESDARGPGRLQQSLQQSTSSTEEPDIDFRETNV